MLTLIIRHMQENDITFVQEIARISWHHTYEGITVQETFVK